MALALAAGAPAWAALGEKAASVETDRQQMRAAVAQRTHAAYTVHELTSANGVLVREFVGTSSGTVFAVSWHGPFKPDLRQLLGAQFDRIAQSKHRQDGGRGHLVVEEGNVVFVSTGHMRSFHGQAYLKDAVPSGVSIDELQ